MSYREVVKANPSKIDAMVEWPSLRGVKSLIGFLGLTGYCRNFIKDYGLIVAPLIALLEKDSF